MALSVRVFSWSIQSKARWDQVESPSRFRLLFAHDPSGQARGYAFSENRFAVFGIMRQVSSRPAATRAASGTGSETIVHVDAINDFLSHPFKEEGRGNPRGVSTQR
jgi:hypothetical protein